MSKKYRILYHPQGYTVQYWVEEISLSTGRKWVFWGPKAYRIEKAHWETFGTYDYSEMSNYFSATIFKSVDEAENYIKGLREEVAKEVNYE